MPETKRKVVNLQSAQVESQVRESQPKRRLVKKTKSRASEIDQVFHDEEISEETKKEFKTIEQPIQSNGQSDFFRNLSIVLVLLLVGMGAYLYLSKDKNSEMGPNIEAGLNTDQGSWYSLELVNGETYYGYIKNRAADPIVLEDVYYNYNQLNDEDSQEDTSKSNIRLVKRGKESHGPSGTMEIVRAQALFMEELGEESKILKAILNYENQ